MVGVVKRIKITAPGKKVPRVKKAPENKDELSEGG